MKRLLLLIVVGVMMFSLAGCGERDNKIKVGYWYNNGNEKINNKLIMDEFAKMYPDYEIEMVYIPYTSFSEQVLSMAAANNLPDVLWVKDTYLAMLAQKGLLEDLGPYMAEDTEFDPDKYVHNALEFTQVDGTQYALPRDVGVQVMALNLDVFEAAGVQLPEADWTWDDMIEVGQSLTKAGDDGNTEIYGLGWLDYESLIYSNGGRLFSEDGTQSYLDEAKTLEALQMYGDLINVYHISPTPSESQGLGNVFFGGKAGMAVVGPWDFATLNNLGINYDIIPFPSGPQGEGTMKLSGLPIAMNSNSKHKEVAYELIKFLAYSDTAQSMLAEHAIAMPSVENIAKSDAFMASDLTPPSMNHYFDALDNTQIIVHFDGEMAALNGLSPFLDEIYLGDQSAEAIKEALQETVQKILDENSED